MTRLDRLQQYVRDRQHARKRILMPPEWQTCDLPVPLVERKAVALALLMERMPLVVQDDELIVGSRTVFGCLPDTDLISDPSHVSLHAYPHYARADEIALLGAKSGLSEGTEGGDQACYVVFGAGEASAVGHNVAGYQIILDKGIDGIIKSAQTAIGKLDELRHPFLRAVCVVYSALRNLILRYRDYVIRLTVQASETRRAELENIARVLDWISGNPPRCAQEAVQLYWFTHLALLMESHGAICNGRIDQLLARYEDSADDQQWIELLGCLIVKLNEQSDVHQGSIEYAGMDNIVIAGLRPDGTDGTNRITAAYLEAVLQTRLVAPELSVRLHNETPDWLINRVTDLIASGINHIALYNDTVFVPNLVDAGIAPEDARDYAIDLCQDVSIGGRADFFLGGQFSLAHTLLETLEDAPDNISYTDLVVLYKQAIAEKIKTVVRFCNNAEKTQGARCNTCVHTENRIGVETLSPLPFFSGICVGAVEQGLDMTQGSLKYGHKGINLFTATNAINSLSAIKQAVYEQMWLTLADLKTMLKQNYDGYETIRLRLEGLPKWGNDDDSVDLVGKDLIDFGLAEIRKHRTSRGDPYLAGIHQPYNFSFGRRLRATPDGRKAGEPVPVGISPMSGTDNNGPTAVFSSNAKLNPALCQWNYALALKFHPALFEGDGKEKFSQMIKTAIKMKIMEFQINVLDDEVLRDAQLHPEKHGNIIVRVWGYSAYFVKLPREMQDEIIARTVHRSD